jgi:2-polyprenyl-6-methoxyphenol hydroxylase-like FAD-dependent oxidoreductase
MAQAEDDMNPDVAIIGGGLAGSLAAAMLGRAGVKTAIIDPHPVYPPEFRCEKLDGPQIKTLEQTGFADPVLRAGTPDRECWIARLGCVVEKRPGDQLGIMYDTLVNTIRAEIPHDVVHIRAKAVDIETSPERQSITLSDGTTITARLIILANGLNIAIQQKLGIERSIISPRHSISIGFDVEPVGGGAFPFPALTYYAERPSDHAALLTLFPIGKAMRANLFVYRDPREPWFERLRQDPEATLHAMWPNLRRITGDFAASRPLKIRPVDLYETSGCLRDGLVLVGDAFSTSCPAAGTGARKALVDVERLCNGYAANWLATPGMQQAKIAQFYKDRTKVASDRLSTEKAFALRAFSTNESPLWTARRWAKFAMHWTKGMSRPLRPSRKPPAAGAGAGAYLLPRREGATQSIGDT